MGRRTLGMLLLATAGCATSGVIVAAQSPAPTTVPQSRLMHQGDLKAPTAANSYRKPSHDAPLRGGEVTRGKGNIIATWFSDATSRYRHTPFDSESHPTTVSVSTVQNRFFRFQLPKDSVFEDRTPRLVDVDGDGQDEVIVVRSYERKGSALAILGVKGAQLEIIAETPPLGLPFQWLNPAGFADFDGDGRPDIALVATPHREGELQFWTLRDGRLEQIGSTDDVSNHVQGSRHMKLSVVADFNGDGIPDIALPSQDRRQLRFITLAGGKLVELGQARLPAPASEDFELVMVDGRPAVRVGLSGGRGVTISPCRDIQDWEMEKGSC